METITMIYAKCFTNLDDYSIDKWPTKFTCRPQVGDSVESKRGRRLKIVHITHSMNNVGDPLLFIELHN